MADRILKPDSGNDLILQNDDASAKIEINEDGSMPVTGTLDVSGATLTTSSAQKTAIVDGGKGNLTKSDVGLSNVTNNAQVPASGGTFTGDVDISNAELEVSNTGTTGNIATIRIKSTEGNVGNGDVLGQISFKSSDSGRSGDPAAAIKAISSEADGSHTDLTFSTGENADAASEKMRIDSTGNVDISSGDLSLQRGSATNSLTRQLTIGGARNGTGSKYAELLFQNYDDDGSASDYAGASISAFIDNDGTDGGELSFSTSDNASGTSEKMRIDSSGSITTPNGQFNGEIGASATFASALFNKGNDGYVILPSGIEIKWGSTSTISSIGTSGSHTHTYTTNQGGAFATATLWGIVWTADRNASPVAVGGLSGNITVDDSNSSITFKTNSVAGSSGSSIRFLFLAIGH